MSSILFIMRVNLRLSIATALLTVWGRFARHEGGNIAILFGASAIPLLLFLGGAVDLSRYNRHKADLAGAVDAASLALARNAEAYAGECVKTGDTCPKAGEFVKDYIASMLNGGDKFEVASITVKRTKDGFSVEAGGDMQASFLPLGRLLAGGKGTDSLAIDVQAGVARTNKRLELALVLDNTGSMAWTDSGSVTRMENLKAAAGKLLDVLMPAGAKETDDVRIAVVPFEGTVNIKNDSFDWNWIDKGEYEEWTVTEGKGKKKTTTTYKQWYGRSKFNGVNVGTVESKNGTARRPSHFWLYELMGVSWAGCVEMRQEVYDAQTGTTIPYDILDTPPDQSKPETLFVQSFWPDEPDGTSTASAQSHNDFTNNYLNDDIASTSFATRQKNFSKYETNAAWRTDTAAPYATGPNHGCPQPILPLTKSRAEVDASIDGMEPFGAMGTFIPAGLVWGWHVLSPGAPFSEGVGPDQAGKYARTVKAVVLLSDGENSATLTNDSDNMNKSLYSGYGYYSAGRLGTVADNSSADGPNAKLNAKTAALCVNVKNDKIRVYTITFGSIAETTKTLMRNCASESEGEKLYYHAPSGAALEGVFQSIGADLNNLHLSM
jgi:Flp pilus assembly protein TadG